MTKPPPKTFGKVSRDRIKLAGKRRCFVCGKETTNPGSPIVCRKCRGRGYGQ
jgi:DnaJ-class molecular chaperone